MINRTLSALIQQEAAMPDLVSRLTEAAEAAIRNERPALEHPAGHVRGVTIELMLTSTGQVHEAACYVERRTSGAALLDRQQAKGR
jgi:hypothetical protein